MKASQAATNGVRRCCMIGKNTVPALKITCFVAAGCAYLALPRKQVLVSKARARGLLVHQRGSCRRLAVPACTTPLPKHYLARTSPAVIFALWLPAAPLVAAQADCQGVLAAGVYNTIATSTSASSYSQFQQAMCYDASSYTYAQYLNDAKSSSASSSYLNVAAGEPGAGFGRLPKTCMLPTFAALVSDHRTPAHAHGQLPSTWGLVARPALAWASQP
jgi:hypothetical protein